MLRLFLAAFLTFGPSLVAQRAHADQGAPRARVIVAGILQEPRADPTLRFARPDEFNQAMVAVLRKAGVDAITVPQLEHLHASGKLMLGGRVNEVQCLRNGPESGCRIAIGWQVFDTHEQRLVYQTQTRAAVYSVASRTVAAVKEALVLGALASLLKRPGFAQVQEPLLVEEPHFAPATFKRCGAPALALPHQAEDATTGTIVLRVGDGIGSGFILNDEGLVLTAAHVVRPGLMAHFRNTEDFAMARVVRINHTIDVALLRVEQAPSSRCLELADKVPALGSDVYAIGAPSGAAFSLSRGIVSSVREIGGMNVLQTDAPISPGNSGGPLLGADGKVVGVVSFKFVRQGVEGVSFAVTVPAALAALGLTPAAVSSAELGESSFPPNYHVLQEADDPVPPVLPIPSDRAVVSTMAAEATPEHHDAKPGAIDADEFVRWTGVGIAAVGLVMATATAASYDRDSTTQDEYETLRSLNDVGWAATFVGAGVFGLSFMIGSSGPDGARGPSGPGVPRVSRLFFELSGSY